MIRHTGTPRLYGRLVAILLGAALFAGAIAADAPAHVLTFSAARTAALAKANTYAHQPTRIKTMLRQAYMPTTRRPSGRHPGLTESTRTTRSRCA